MFKIFVQNYLPRTERKFQGFTASWFRSCGFLDLVEFHYLTEVLSNRSRTTFISGI